MSKKTVLLADREGIFAEGVKASLAGRFEVLGLATDGKALLGANETLKPDVVIIDFGIPLLNDLQTLIKLRNQSNRPKIVVLTMAADTASVTEALRAGVVGYVLKTSPPAELLAAVEKVLRGGTYVTPRLPFAVGKISRLSADKELRSLSQREREVLQLIAKGHTSREIAAALHISTKTVESHRTNISRHLDIHSIAELTRYAIERGLL
jgi:DNA-binding NarL/FixJ family response regulator